MITQQELKEILNYNSETGVFVWNHNLKECGSIQNYNRIQINKIRYPAHRLAWLYVYGSFPNGIIDHINGNPSDNRIENLRDVSTRQNGQNRKEHRNGKLVGCTYNKRDSIYQARISLNGISKNLGSFKTQQEAHEAYLKHLTTLDK